MSEVNYNIVSEDIVANYKKGYNKVKKHAKVKYNKKSLSKSKLKNVMLYIIVLFIFGELEHPNGEFLIRFLTSFVQGILCYYVVTNFSKINLKELFN